MKFLLIVGLLPLLVSGKPKHHYYDEEPAYDEYYDAGAEGGLYPIEEYLDLCGGENNAYHMEHGDTFAFQSPYYGIGDYPKDIKCTMHIIGDARCQPEVSCDVDLASNEDCSDEYLAISDGLGGRETFCGHNRPKGALQAHKGRDLYLEFNSGIGGGKGFKCTAKCGQHNARKLEVVEHRKEEVRCVCGLQNKDDRIVGGEDAKMNEFPWLVAIVFKGSRMPMCGGAVINDRIIMTAAHCFFFERFTPDMIDVLFHARILDQTLQEGWKNVSLGEEGSIQGSGYNLKSYTDAEEKTQRFEVEEIINHPLFTPDYDYDVALLKLKKKIKLEDQDAPTPICLPPDETYTTSYDETKPTVSGWGKPHGVAKSTTKVLQKLEVPTINIDKCQSWMPYNLTQRMICAGYEEGGKDACTGDSGGPLFLKTSTNQFNQIGIVSWGEGCALKQRPGLYSRVTELSQWVQYRANKFNPTWCKTTKG